MKDRLTFRYKSIDGTEQIGYTEKMLSCRNKQEVILNRLAKYEDLEEQGLIVRLPCKVGDKLYLPYIYDSVEGVAF